MYEHFLGTHEDKNYKMKVKNLLIAYKNKKCNISFKIHFLDSHIDFVPPNNDDVSDEHGKCFHQVIVTIEKCYVGKSKQATLADYCLTIMYGTDQTTYKRKSPYIVNLSLSRKIRLLAGTIKRVK